MRDGPAQWAHQDVDYTLAIMATHWEHIIGTSWCFKRKCSTAPVLGKRKNHTGTDNMWYQPYLVVVQASCSSSPVCEECTNCYSYQRFIICLKSLKVIMSLAMRTCVDYTLAIVATHWEHIIGTSRCTLQPRGGRVLKGKCSTAPLLAKRKEHTEIMIMRYQPY